MTQVSQGPLLFALLLPLVLALVVSELSSKGLSPQTLAMLGVLSALGCLARPLGAGTAGLELTRLDLTAGLPRAAYASMILLAITIGELMISPIALSISTKIAPPMFKTQMVALNFLGFSLGFTLGGVLFKEGFNDKAPLDFYWMLCGIGVITGVALLLLVPVLNRMLKGAD